MNQPQPGRWLEPHPERRRGVSLRQKAWMITAGVLVALAALLAVGVDGVFRKSFARMEDQWVRESVRRVESAVAGEIDGIERSTKDYATWTDTYEYLANASAPYVESNLLPATFGNLQLDAFLLFDAQGVLHSGRTYRDGVVSTDGVTELGAAFGGFARDAITGGRKSGLIRLGDRIAAFALFPVLRDDGTGPARGTLAQVRYLDSERVAWIGRSTNLNVAMDSSGNRETSGTIHPPAEAVAATGDFVIEKVDDRLLLAHVPILDHEGRRVAMWHVRLGRQIHVQGLKARVVFYAVICVLVTAAAVLIGWMLRSLVIARLEALHQGVDQVRTTSDLSLRLPVQGSDELADLTEGINQMLAAISRAEAERVVAEEGRQRLNQQLQQAQKLEAIGTLTGGLAHDFNNLLTSIQGSTMLLRLEAGGADGEAHLRRIEQAAAQAASLVRQMMAFGRRSPAVFTNVRLGDVARDALQLMRSSVPRGVSFQFRNEAVNDMVYGDGAQLQQVIVNLATNASHAMASGSGRLAIYISEVVLPLASRPETGAVAEGNYVQLIISDTGCGIPPETLPRIFEPFYTTKPVGSGTGLGLAVVHGIVAHHYGTIGVESEVGRGTRMIIHLPQVVPESKPEVDGNAGADPASTLPLPVKSILLVDDDDLVRDTLKASLSRIGYNVKVARSAVEGLKLIRDDRAAFGAVLTDQMMPGMTGTEFGEVLAREHPTLGLVLVTGYASALNEPTVRAMGFSAMLMKPVAMDVLDRTLRTVCSKSVD